MFSDIYDFAGFILLQWLDYVCIDYDNFYIKTAFVEFALKEKYLSFQYDKVAFNS